MIFVDSNVLLDIIEGDGRWSEWSHSRLEDAAGQRLVVNAVVFAEIARQFASEAKEQEFLSDLGIIVLPLDDPAAFLAGKAHATYRRAGGRREAILADFLVAGHASTLDAMLLTRDRARFATYFPKLTLIAPERDDG